MVSAIVSGLSDESVFISGAIAKSRLDASAVTSSFVLRLINVETSTLYGSLSSSAIRLTEGSGEPISSSFLENAVKTSSIYLSSSI